MELERRKDYFDYHDSDVIKNPETFEKIANNSHTLYILPYTKKFGNRSELSLELLEDELCIHNISSFLKNETSAIAMIQKKEIPLLIKCIDLYDFKVVVVVDLPYDAIGFKVLMSTYPRISYSEIISLRDVKGIKEDNSDVKPSSSFEKALDDKFDSAEIDNEGV
jgi:hypothetical protein